MKERKNIKWFLGIPLLAFLLLVLVVVAFAPALGLAQDGNTGNLGAHGEVGDDASASPQTDDPAGRVRVPLADGNLPQNNLLGAEAGEATPLGRTDDPLGRVMIPLSDESPSDSNLEATHDGASTLMLSPEEAAAAEAAIASADAYQSPLVISSADFTADGANPDSFFFPFGGGYMQGDSENYGCMQAPAYLPNGATVEDMFVTVYDNDTTFDVFIDLRRVDNFAGGIDTMASAQTTGDLNSIQVVSDSTINYPVVVYPDYSYYVTTCLQSDSTRLYSVRLYYGE